MLTTHLSEMSASGFIVILRWAPCRKDGGVRVVMVRLSVFVYYEMCSKLFQVSEDCGRGFMTFSCRLSQSGVRANQVFH